MEDVNKEVKHQQPTRTLIQAAKALQAEEERVKAERIAAWRNGSLELTDIEIYELALKILIDKFEIYGFIQFFQEHFKHLSNDQPIDQPPQSQSAKDVRLGRTEQMPTTEPHD